MFCGNCGRQLPEGAQVCPQCGTRVAKEVDFSDVKNYAGQKVQQVSDGIQEQVQDFKQAQVEERASRQIRDVHEMYVNADEEQKAVVGEGYLNGLLDSGVLRKGFWVLTNRRLYYRGKCYYKIGGRYIKTDEDYTVEIQDISSSGFTYTRYLWVLALSVIPLALAVINFLVESELRHPNYGWTVCFGVLGAALVAAYCLIKQTMYTITFAGGSLSIKASSYGLKEVRAFDKTLHFVKDTCYSSYR